MTPPTFDRYLQNFDLEIERFAAISPERLEDRLPHLSEWTVRSAVTHTARILRFVDLALQSDAESPPEKSDVPVAPEDETILAWLVDAASNITDTLRTVDGDSVRWTWTGPQPASWYARRLSHEVSMHRWDAQAAWIAPEPISGDIAVDGIDELLEVYAPRRLSFEELAGNGETVHLHATDEETGEWFLEYQPASIKWERSHTKGDVAARGSASDLLLMMWGRIPPTQLDVFGDISLLERWQSAASF